MNKPNSYTPENMIKGRIAEAIIEELLKASGNDVYRFGYESILQTSSREDRTSTEETRTLTR